MRLWEKLRERMMRHPYRTVSELGAVMTYEALVIFAEHFAENLTDGYYGILCHSELGAAMAVLAGFAAEKPVIPLPVRYGREYYEKILGFAEPPALITDLGDGLCVIGLVDAPKANFRVADGTAVILFTSGSTGVPKGIMLSGDNLLTNIVDISEYFPVSDDDTILISRPLYHSSVLTGEFLTALWNGAKIVFSSEAFQPKNILELMKKHNITVFGSTPPLLSMLSRFAKGKEGIGVRLLSVSGECMTEGMAKVIRSGFPDAMVYCGYGLSEASPRVAYLPPELFDVSPTVAGLPLSHVELRIAKSGRSGIGEVLIRGDSVMLGYFGDKERTDSIIRDGWLHTGDMGYFDNKGMLVIKGRRDDMIIRAGMNIYPAEIENALSADARVTDVLAYGFERNGTREIGLKICGDFSDTAEVLRLCRKSLPSFQIPSRIELTDSADTLCGGKKKRKREADPGD